MKITSAKFVRGIIGSNKIFENKIPQVAFVGRSNVGKSSLINTLLNQKNLAKTSSYPGRTAEINFYLVNDSFYLVDLPGYGYAKTSLKEREKTRKLIRWYLFESGYDQKKIFLIIDAFLGGTTADLEVLENLKETKKEIVIVANKIDKLKKSERQKQMEQIEKIFAEHKIIYLSAKEKTGVKELTGELL